MEIKRLNIKKLNNTRDLGGLPLIGGKKIKSGLLFRSGRLYNLPKKSICALRDLGISTVVELRIDTEVREHPDVKIDGVKYYHLPLNTTATEKSPRDKKMRHTWTVESHRLGKEFENTDEYMKEVYKLILFGDESKESLKSFFEVLEKAQGGVLWHCAGGKDRTGICAMLLEGLLGADEETIIADYMASEKFLHRKFTLQRGVLKAFPITKNFRNILFAIMDCKEEFINCALDEIRIRFGSIENYCKNYLGIDEATVALLKEKYTE